MFQELIHEQKSADIEEIYVKIEFIFKMCFAVTTHQLKKHIMQMPQLLKSIQDPALEAILGASYESDSGAAP